VLICGESGTGKEVVARAVHEVSPRAAEPFLAFNCAALSESLLESELFGHEKGAFTGAIKSQKGCFEEADGGTLFLDELGELPLAAQVQLLRALQEGEIVRIGANKATKVDVRVIAATNRTLTEEIARGRFREDLFYRLAVVVLKLPPLRERREDLSRIVDHVLAQVNGEGDPGAMPKKLSAGARTVWGAHPWPGNVRELVNTVRRAVLWSDGETITAQDARDALLQLTPVGGDAILGRPLGDGFDLQALLDEVARHYLRRAMSETHGNKSRAAELVGLPSYQTLSNWLEKHGVAANVKRGMKSD
jgi:DNA-binding NtrC family response regulator